MFNYCPIGAEALIFDDELKHIEDESVELVRMMKGMMRNLTGEKS